MLVAVHVKMMHQALDGLVSERALKRMIGANIRVDAPWNQLGRHELHFDDNAFDGAYAYLAAQRGRIAPALQSGQREDAWDAFGRLTHTAQDFYSHTNYVDLWTACQPDGMVPPASQIEPLDETLLSSKALRSGKAYLPLGLLSFIPGVGKWVDVYMPADSHARMHLDSAARGPMFEYAFQAAVKRTHIEFETVRRSLPAGLAASFADLDQ
ncbi:MAG TPA: hypothetical protein VFH29_00615 [Anaerolineales bacterium]|nr:hypothetical protein [Anaerolineales bacterium]